MIIFLNCSPDGKKFRSRNELRTFFIQTGSKMNSEDFDFSVKGKGHHNKGKTPTKKTEAENSKENQVSKTSKALKKATTPVVNKRASQTPKSNVKAVERNIKSSERPKRELRKRLRSEPDEELPIFQPVYDDELPEESEEKDEVSNVKLKVKVGYTATGAMIRPPANGGGGLKKKRRFRNMKVKKTANTKVAPKASTSPSKRISSVAAAVAANAVQEDKIEPTTPLSKESNRKGKNSAIEPVAGPSGLQKNKRSPRRVLRRKIGGSEEDDDDDFDYDIGLYPNVKQMTKVSEKETEERSIPTDDPLKIEEEEEAQVVNENINGSKETNGDSHPIEQSTSSFDTNGASDTLNTSSSEIVDEVGPMDVMDAPAVLLEEAEVCEDDQVVVIGDSVETLHNYAKPHVV